MIFTEYIQLALFLLASVFAVLFGLYLCIGVFSFILRHISPSPKHDKQLHNQNAVLHKETL